MKSSFHYGYVIAACCFLIMFVVVGLIMSTAGVFYRPVSDELGVEVGQFGLYMSLNFIFSTLSLPFAGRMVERFSTRRMMTLSALAASLLLMAMSAFNALWQFYIAGAVFGVLMSFLLYLSFPVMIPRWFKKRMGLFIGICSAGSGIGGFVFNPIAGGLIASYGWRTAYFVFGAMVLLLVVPVLGVFMRDYPEEKGLHPYGEDVTQEAARNTVATDGVTHSEALRMPAFYGLIVFAFLMNATALLNVFFPTYIQGEGFSIEQASWIASGVMLGVTVGKVGLGFINDHSVLGGLLTTTGLGTLGLFIMLTVHTSISIIILGGFLFGWAYAGVSVQTPMLLRKVFGSKAYTAIYSNVSMAFTAGGAIGAGAWGLISDRTSFMVVFLIGITFLVISAAIGCIVLKLKTSDYETV